MVIGLIIFIFMLIPANLERLADMFPIIADNQQALQSIQDTGAYNYFITLNRAVRYTMMFLALLEAFIELILIIRWFPRFVSRQIKKLKRDKDWEVKMIQKIKLKQENNIVLNNREKRFLHKYSKDLGE